MKSPSEVREHRILIGKKIKYLRIINKVTQVELGTELGFTSTGAISQIENGTKGLKLSSIIKAAKFFGLHPAVLISPIPIEDYSDYKLLSKVIRLIEMKHEKPDMAKPLLGAISGLLEHISF